MQLTRAHGARYATTGFLDALGRAYLGLGELDASEQAFQEALGLMRERGYHTDEFAFWGGLGLVALARGEARLALEHYARAEVIPGSDSSPGMSVLMAWTGAARLILGEVDLAVDATAQAVALYEAGQ